MTNPTSTYRIQFRNGMTFDRATALVPYMKRLGISHLYASPIFTAAPGSTHGYDVADANEIDPGLGGREGFERLSAALKQAGLGLILDIVPNHMAAALENRWWRSIVEWGSDSRHARYFDVDWSRRLTLPFLGDDFEKVLGAGEISLVFDQKHGCLALAYFDSRYPIAPRTYEVALDGVETALATKIRQLAATASPEAAEDFHKAMRSLAGDPASIDLEAALADISGDRKRLDDLHSAQPWRLMSWRDVPRDLSYRRFFEITGLAGLRVEDEAVFEASHELVLDLVRTRKVDGLRIDHVDGLADPAGYLKRLREEIGPDCYLVVEKILAYGEHIPSDWPIAGTTGYEFIASLSDVLVDDASVERFQALYGEAAGRPVEIDTEIRAAKGLMADVNFAGEGTRLLEIARRIADEDATARELPEHDLRQALRELLIGFPVYRTYGTEIGLRPADVQRLNDVMDAVRAGPHAPKPEALGFIGRILAGDVAQASDGLAREFRTRFQQLTGPLMAKSIEDTLFYRLNPLMALNEVGAEPHGRSFSVANFHKDMQARLSEQPLGLSATSTHDTKRGEDARARLYALAEQPDLWKDAFDAWREENRASLMSLKDGAAPEPSAEWMIFQGLVGVLPHDLSADDVAGLKALEERFLAYLEKSLREAKLRTGWNDQNKDYEHAVASYAQRLFSPDATAFRRDVIERMQPLFLAGGVNSVTQTLIKLCAPGIPDIYQGSEGLDLSLVDPDNRRSPDFESLAANLDASTPFESEDAWLDGRMKQMVVATLLPLRRERPDLFLKGDYVPLDVTGERADHVVAFGRRHGNDRIVVVAPRRLLGAIRETASLPDAAFWRQTAVTLTESFAGRAYRDLFAGATVDGGAELPLGDILASVPFAVLVSS